MCRRPWAMNRQDCCNFCPEYRMNRLNMPYSLPNGKVGENVNTAPFNNSVMVIAAPVRQFGLTTNNSRFNYRVRSRAPRERSSQVIEITPYVLFDAYRPALDTTSAGIQHSPFHSNGQTLRANL